MMAVTVACRIGLLAACVIAIPVLLGIPLSRWLGDPWSEDLDALSRLGTAHGIGLAWMGLVAWSCGIAGLTIAAFVAATALVPLGLWWKAAPAKTLPVASPRLPVAIAIVAVSICAWRGARLDGTDPLLYMGWIRDHAHSNLVLPPDPFGGIHAAFWLGRTPWHFLIGMATRIAGLEIDRAWDWLPALLVVPFLISLYTFLIALGCSGSLGLSTLALTFLCMGGSRYEPFAMLAWSRLGPLSVLWLAFAASIRWLRLGDRRALLSSALLLWGASCLNLRFALDYLLAVLGLMAASLGQGSPITGAWSLLGREALLLALGAGAAVGLSLPFHLHQGIQGGLPGPPVALGIAPFCLFTSESHYILDPTIPQVVGGFGACGLAALTVLAASMWRGWADRRDLRGLAGMVGLPLAILFNPWVFPAFARIYVVVHDSERILDPVPWPAALAHGLLFLGSAFDGRRKIRGSLARLSTGALCVAVLIPQALCRLETLTPSFRKDQWEQSPARFAQSFRTLDAALAPGTRVLAGLCLTDAIPAFTSWSVVDGGNSMVALFNLAGEQIPHSVLRALLEEPGREAEARNAMIEERLEHVLFLEDGETKSLSTAARLVASGQFTRTATSGPLSLLAIRPGPPAPCRTLPTIEPHTATAPGDVKLAGCRVTLGDGASGQGMTLHAYITFEIRGGWVLRPTPYLELRDTSFRSDPLYNPAYGRLYLFLKGILTGRKFRFVVPLRGETEPMRWDGPRHDVDLAIDLSFLHEGMGRNPYEVRVGTTGPGEPLRRWLSLAEPELPCVATPGALRRVPDATERRFHFEYEARTLQLGLDGDHRQGRN